MQTKVKVSNRTKSGSTKRVTPAKKLVPGGRLEHLTKAGLGVFGLCAIWVAISFLREQSMRLLAGSSEPVGGGLLGSRMVAEQVPAYFWPFLTVSLALVALGVVMVWSSTDVVGERRRVLLGGLDTAVLNKSAAAGAHASATARCVHLDMRQQIMPALVTVDEQMTQLWLLREVALKAAADKSGARGYWSAKDSLPKMASAPYADVLGERNALLDEGEPDRGVLS